ncbi:unnamed protein product [Mytilus edulis]|uniref:WSC domain-containing protein n=1 Tax=Mytilus edulis TaxID=6550 RepID=A0A8S3REJ7_MYTED|nr:unnamed protein product [Mytilus edulis]
MQLFFSLHYLQNLYVKTFQCVLTDSNEYVGCFVDTYTRRLLPHRYVLNDGTNSPDMENNLCFLYCKEQGYMYSGTQSYTECWCGDDPYQFGPEDVIDYYIQDYDCNRMCLVDFEQMCGGGWRLSVYETGDLPLKPGQIQFKLVSNNTILTAPTNQVLTSRSKIECARYCKLSDDCNVFVISTETGKCSMYNMYDSYTVMCEEFITYKMFLKTIPHFKDLVIIKENNEILLPLVDFVKFLKENRQPEDTPSRTDNIQRDFEKRGIRKLGDKVYIT